MAKQPTQAEIADALAGNYPTRKLTGQGEKPNWSKWNHVPEPMLWEAVALSLDIEPGAEGRIVFPDRQKRELFTNRLDIAERNLGLTKALRPISFVMGEPSNCTVSMSAFAAWARSIWEIPQELSILAKGDEVSRRLSSDEVAAEKPLATQEKETLLKIVIGIAVTSYGFDPAASRSPIPAEIAKHMDEAGVGVTDETVLKWLRQAAQLLPKGKTQE